MCNFSQPIQLRKTFDVIIVCDCLYFVNFHRELLMTVDSYLSELGSAYLVNPSRGSSLSQFLSVL